MKKASNQDLKNWLNTNLSATKMACQGFLDHAINLNDQLEEDDISTLRQVEFYEALHQFNIYGDLAEKAEKAKFEDFLDSFFLSYLDPKSIGAVFLLTFYYHP